MTKRKIALLILIAMLVNLMQVAVFATEPSAVKEYTSADGAVVLNEDITANGCDGAVYAHDGANVTINGGNIYGQICGHTDHDEKGSQYAMAVYANASTVTINGGTFKNDSDPNTPSQADLIYAKNGANIIINGGTFKCSTPAWTLNASDSSQGTITVTGGKFFEFNPADNTVTSVANKAAGKLDVVVPAGYSVVSAQEADGTWYEVQKLNEAKVFDNTTAILNEAIKANGCDGAVYAKNGANVTINGGTIHAQICGHKHVDSKGKIGEYAMAVFADASTVTITGGTFTNDADPYTPAQTDLIYVKNGGEIIIEGGTFKSSTPKWTLNASDSAQGTITVKGGKFYQFNPADNAVTSEANKNAGKLDVVVPEDYKVVSVDADWYEVVCAHKNGQSYEETPATYKEVGERAHWICDLCKKVFTDATATTEIADLVIPKLAEVENNNADVTEDAFDTAMKESEAISSTTVVIPVVETEKTVNSVTVPVSSLTDVAKENKELSIQTSQVTATMDVKAIEKIVEQAGNNEEIKIEIVKIEETALNETQKAAIKDKEVSAIISAEIIANGKVISDFGGGKVTLEIPFTPAQNTKGTDYVVVYIADDGKVTEVPTKYVDGFLVVELEHFSEYAIVKVATTGSTAPTGSNSTASDSTTSGSSSTGSSSTASAPATTTTSNPKTGDNIGIYVAALFVAVAGIVAIVVIKKRNNTK